MTAINGAPASRLALMSIAAALATMALKLGAWWLSGSVGLMSDALESFVNLGSGIVAFVTLRWAEQPPDDGHEFGHDKAEYFSSGFEGALIFIAALVILWHAVPRLLLPQPLDRPGIGLAVAVVAGLINLFAALALLRGAQRLRSPALEADARHLLSDVWTTVGVVAAVALVALTGWLWLDALIAIVVALYLLWVGQRLLRSSASGLLDPAWPADERAALDAVLDAYRAQGIAFHAIRTRSAASRRFVSLHVLVPGAWTVQRGHDLLESIEQAVAARVGTVSILTHLEPIEDPAAQDDLRLERTAPSAGNDT
ncbi:cation diffusion facilitator family transporter [Solimonas marina]|uniref:Cation transporter n=1 Tax=Solimonas marina TaxID=2714601 RepID=A0A969W9F9_9GAMM|nr:cation diffusion facilitator family transporter [Solimonas marina]NKF22349.1 cation transporter [Solimonas marina]